MNVVFLPLVSIFLFIISNAYWIFELLIHMSISGPTEDVVEESAQNSTYKNVVTFATDKAKENAKKFEAMKSLSTWRKIFFPLHKICFIGCFLLWQTMVIGCYFSFRGFENEFYLKITVYSFIGFCILANCHLVLLVIAMDIMAPLAAVCLLFYPCCVMLCFRRKSQVTTDCTSENASN